MRWQVSFAEEFEIEVETFPVSVQEEITSLAELLAALGPQLKRPYCDTLKGSQFANMKELRFSAADGEWRLAFAFDPKRSAILLVAGDKSGISQKLFYKTIIRTADERFKLHLATLNQN
jgi:hypothetical protein